MHGCTLLFPPSQSSRLHRSSHDQHSQGCLPPTSHHCASPHRQQKRTTTLSQEQEAKKALVGKWGEEAAEGLEMEGLKEAQKEEEVQAA